MKMSDKRKFVVAPKSREIGPHVGRQYLYDQKVASDSSDKKKTKGKSVACVKQE
jgi:hypothetical protein